MSSELNIWYWKVRFFRPKQEEEFYVRVSPAGEIVGYEHKIEEARAGASPDRAAAEAAAQNFLRNNMGVDLSKWAFLPEEANSSKEPNRLDWSFTWEKRDFRAKDAPYRLRVELQGDRAGSSKESLQVPEAWERSYAKLRSKNILYNQVAIIPYLALLVAVIGLGILLTMRKQTSWGGAIKLGIVVSDSADVHAAQQLAAEPHGLRHELFLRLLCVPANWNALLFGVFSALTVAPPIPGAEPLYRWSQPGRLRLGESLHVARITLEGIFLRGDGRHYPLRPHT